MVAVGRASAFVAIAVPVALHCTSYNVVRSEQTLRCTPAKAADVSTTFWDLADMVRMLEQREACREF